MTTTMATTVKTLRNWLGDYPASLTSGATISSTSATTFTASDATLIRNGVVYEFDDGADSNAECILSRSSQTTAPTIVRGWHASTAATHANGCLIWVAPRFEYNQIARAVNMALDVDLYANGVYEMVEHQVTSSSTTHAYNSPATTCERVLDIYQRVNSTDAPQRQKLDWSQYRNADTTLWSNGKVFEIYGNYGVPGTALYYVNCAHRLGITTITTQQERAVHLLAAAYLLEWEEVARAGGPTNQGDKTVTVGAKAGIANFYREQAMRIVRDEASRLKQLTEDRREFIKRP